MNVVVDQMGRIVIPKQLRDRLGIEPGASVDVSEYGGGLHIAVGERTARLERRAGRLVATSDAKVTDDDVFRLIDAARK